MVQGILVIWMCATMDDSIHIQVEIVKFYFVRIAFWSIRENVIAIGKLSWLKKKIWYGKLKWKY